uniref:Uncharacterized protein n=1 Tax=viral metagenome TaxID=1070528 RepID=A0A6C0AG52_9ZZZZ
MHTIVYHIWYLKKIKNIIQNYTKKKFNTGQVKIKR